MLKQSKLEAVFLTNDFDDPLEGFDTNVYIPCLRTDDLVFHLAKPEVRAAAGEGDAASPSATRASLRQAIGKLFEHFKSRGARACAISLPPDFSPTKVERRRREHGAGGDACATATAASESHRRAIWQLRVLDAGRISAPSSSCRSI